MPWGSEMKKTVLFSLFFFLLFASASSFAKVKQSKDHFWREEYDVKGTGLALVYLVDSQTEMCFASYGGQGLTSVSCSSLKKRPEWSGIITWDDDIKMPKSTNFIPLPESDFNDLQEKSDLE